MNKKRKYLLGLTVSFILAGCTAPSDSSNDSSPSASFDSVNSLSDNHNSIDSTGSLNSIIDSSQDSITINSTGNNSSQNSVSTVTIDSSNNNSSDGISTGISSSNQPSISSPGSVSTNTSTSTGGNSTTSTNTSSSNNGEDFSTCDLSGYYTNARCLQSSQLKTKLHEIIYTSHKDNISYAASDSYIADANEDPNNKNNCILFYSGKSMAKTRYNPSSSQPDAWNKEHTWAKSHGDFASALAGRDLHHLMPTYSGVNNARGNNFFDNLNGKGGEAVTKFNSYKQSVTVEYSDPSDMSYKTSTAFEPRNAVKGDTARIIFYMALRYSVAGRGTSSILSLVDSGTINGPYMGKKSVLLAWHLQDPVDDFERARNEKIYGFQGNRNPFIDHPELVNMLTW